MAEQNYLIDTTTLSTTASGTTIGSGNTQSASFVVARTMVRTGVPSAAFLATSQTWSLHYVVSTMVTPYELRLKLQRRNSGGTVQTESGYTTVRTATGTYDDNLTWTSGTWAANDQLAVVWEHRRPSGSGNKSSIIDANGASYVTAPTAAGTPHTATPADSLSLADARALGRGLGVADTGVLSDILAREVISARAVADTLALADNVSPVKTSPGGGTKRNIKMRL